MEIIGPICYGMNVHKDTVVVVISITHKKTRTIKCIQEMISTLNHELLKLKLLLPEHKCFDARIE